MKIFLLTIFTKITFKIIRFLKKGNGYTFSGFVILKMFPNILKSKNFKYKNGIIIVTGTNGKTTTTKLISDVLKKNKYKVAHNLSGSNLLRGIVTTLFLDLNFFGKPKSTVVVLEVDEFNLDLVLQYLTPKALVLLNLSRDQLDRYGETDTILIRWVEVLKNLSKNTTLIIDSTQPVLMALKDVFKGPKITFNDFLPKGLIVSELYNIKNVNACIKVCAIFDIGFDRYKDIINNFKYAYGRGEEVIFGHNNFKIYLAKNPVSFNSNLLNIIDKKNNFDAILFLLNSKIPDGKDVSWIYDINDVLLKSLYEFCNLKNKEIYISGLRAYDMATRLIYCEYDIDINKINLDINNILLNFKHKKNLNIIVFANYTCMLEFRKITLGKNIL